LAGDNDGSGHVRYVQQDSKPIPTKRRPFPDYSPNRSGLRCRISSTAKTLQ